MMPVRCENKSLTHPMESLQIQLLGGFIVGRCTASAIASASRKSFFAPALVPLRSPSASLRSFAPGAR